jgi:hypothetical protein
MDRPIDQFWNFDGSQFAMAAMVDQFCDSYRRAPSSITLDIDDTFDAVHGHQQLLLFPLRRTLFPADPYL